MLGLRHRVAFWFGVLSLLVSMVVAVSVYAFTRTYLVNQRESTSLTRALLDGRAVDAALTGGAAPGDALSSVPAVGSSQALALVGGRWFTRGVTLQPQDLPAGLLSEAEGSGGSRQWFAVASTPYLAIAMQMDDGLYLEVFPVDDLDSGLRSAGWLLVGLGVVAFLLGSLVGRYAGSRLLRPLQELGAGARRLALGDLRVRLPERNDPDLTPISAAFNEMADAMEVRIARERRFVANAAHELRSPMTTIVGTAELLEAHTQEMPSRDVALVTGLAAQSRRMAQTLVDLLELGSAGSFVPAQFESVDLAGLVESILRSRDLPLNLLHGDRPDLRTDARRAERVVGNLIDNANRHGGGVTSISIEREPGFATIHVDDAGPGLGDMDTARLFEPFVRGGATAHGSTQGAGLGLAIATEQAHAITATLTAGRSPDGGARFSLRLPEGIG